MQMYHYVLLSTITTAMVMTNAWIQKEQFYLACLYVLDDRASVMAIYNTILVIVACLWTLCRKIFFGPLRAIEYESIYSKTWMAVVDTCLALSIFRDEFGASSFFMFICLLFVKTFHWLSAERVDFMEQAPVLGRLFHLRMQSTTGLLHLTDLYMVWYSADHIIKYGPSVHILFGFEYAILSTHMMGISAKYVLGSIDAQRTTPMENKPTYMLYIDILTDMFRLCLYTAFFGVLAYHYGIPIHIMRELYITAASLATRVSGLIRYWKATRNMNSRYPEATAEELAATDGICIICREEMESARRLPCGHIFHLACIRSWLQRQQTCPTCRMSVLVDLPAARPANINQHRADALAQPPAPIDPQAPADLPPGPQGPDHTTWPPVFPRPPLSGLHPGLSLPSPHPPLSVN
eukprot:Ihof_evm3s258 gene=Ihof_evmTU3s258